MAAATAAAGAIARRRTALVVGVANARSIAWASASSLLDNGFDVVVTYQNDRFRRSVEGLVSGKNDALQQQLQRQRQRVGVDDGVVYPPPRLHCLPCDVSSDGSVEKLFEEGLPSLPLWDNSGTTKRRRRRLDALVHSVAYAPPDAMKDGGSLLGTSREAFRVAHDVSAYSLILLARHALPYLSAEAEADSAGTGTEEVNDGDGELMSSSSSSSSSIVALSYLGSTRAVPNYNVMGPAKASLESTVRGLALELGPPPHSVRVNAVSAGPVNSLAARGIRNFTDMKAEYEARSMLRRNVTTGEVADVVAFLASGSSGGITGQTIYVDGGYSAVSGPAVGGGIVG